MITDIKHLAVFLRILELKSVQLVSEPRSTSLFYADGFYLTFEIEDKSKFEILKN